MGNQILVGKKLLISLENYGLLESNRIFVMLQDALSPARVIITYGQKDTMYAVLNENPDVVLFYYDSDLTFEAVINMQWQIHYTYDLDCKLMLYSKHHAFCPDNFTRYLLEVINGVTFVETELPHEEVVERVSRCLQAKGVKLLIAADHAFDSNWMRFCVNIFYPGNHIIHPTCIEEIPKADLGESDLMIVGFRKPEDTLNLLDKLKTSEAKSTVLVVSHDEHLKDECANSRIAAHYIFGTLGTSGSQIVNFLRPYLGNSQN